MIPRMPRRYDAVTKFLRETVANDKVGIRVRMQAAMRLSEILLAHDAAKERREIARERTARAELAQSRTEPSQRSGAELPSTEDAQRAALAFLQRANGGMTDEQQ